MSAFKNEREAIAALGDDLYRDTPKSVLALVACHLAMRTGDDFTFAAARREVCAEIVALAANQIITPSQARAAAKALAGA